MSLLGGKASCRVRIKRVCGSIFGGEAASWKLDMC